MQISPHAQALCIYPVLSYVFLRAVVPGNAVHDPHTAHGDDERGIARRNERQRQARRRNTAAYDKRVERGLDPERQHDARYEHIAVKIIAPFCNAESTPQNEPDERKEREHAEKSRFLGDDREDEVAFGKRKKAVFLTRLKQTRAE